MKCKRCAIDTPRLTLSQRHCPTCEREVAAITEADTRRRSRNPWKAKDLSTWRPV